MLSAMLRLEAAEGKAVAKKKKVPSLLERRTQINLRARTAKIKTILGDTTD